MPIVSICVRENLIIFHQPLGPGRYYSRFICPLAIRPMSPVHSSFPKCYNTGLTYYFHIDEFYLGAVNEQWLAVFLSNLAPIHCPFSDWSLWAIKTKGTGAHHRLMVFTARDGLIGVQLILNGFLFCIHSFCV